MHTNLSREVLDGASALSPVVLPVRSVERAALLDRLEEADQVRAVTLSAGAGYGKSTLLAQWAARWQALRGPVVWLGIPPMSDSLHIATHITQALAVEGCEDPLPTAYDDATWSSVTVPRLRECLTSSAPGCLIILDDVMNLIDSRADQLLEALVTGLPEGSQLAVGTRGAVPTALRRLRPTSRTLELGPADLAMTAAEATGLLQADGKALTPARLEEVVDRTEGWPVGIFLMGRALEGEPELMDTGRKPTLAPSWITDYLSDELFAELEPKAAEFLLSVCVLEELDAEVCDAVSGQEGSLALLRTLAATNILVSRVDNPGERYRLHQLFSEFLRDEAQARSRAAYRGAHRRAFEWFIAQGDLERAFHHGPDMDDDSRLGEVLWEVAWRYLTVGQMPVIRRWLAPIGDDRIARDLPLALASFFCSVQEGNRERTRWLSDVVSRHRHAGAITPLLEAHCAVVDAVVGAEGLEHVRGQSAQALDVLLPAQDPWATVALYLRGVANSYLGDMQQGRQDLLDCETACRDMGVIDMRSHCLAALAGFSLLAGPSPDALSLALEARALAFEHDLENVASMSPVFASSAAVLAAHSRRTDAASDAIRALRLMALMETIAPWHSVAGRLLLAQVFWQLGDHERAHVLVNEAKEWEGPAAQSSVLGVIAGEIEALLSGTPTPDNGASALTTAELRVLQYLPTHLSFPEIGTQLFLSRHTIKSQAVSAYRKLGVSSRSEAVERARELGLLPGP